MTKALWHLSASGACVTRAGGDAHGEVTVAIRLGWWETLVRLMWSETSSQPRAAVLKIVGAPNDRHIQQRET